jgi:FixJ family two-component response regulator
MISIVDDDVWAREGLKDLVLSLGYKAITYASAEEFIESGRAKDTACLITDMRMPGLSGLGLRDHLAMHGHRTPFIVVTAHPDERDRSRALNAGAAGYLAKPFEEHALIDCLSRAVRQ